MNIILYIQDNGTPAVITPSSSALEQYGIEAIAQKDVPAGKPYKIIDASELPSTPQETWVIDESELSDGVGADTNEFPAL
jgi:hypothetical protein